MPLDPKLIDKEAREAWKTAPLPELIAHIVDCYHLDTRVEMARLETYAEQAVLLHGSDDPVLLAIRNEVSRLVTEMRAHLTFEEREAFPALLKQASTPGGADLLESMKKILMEEHEAEASLLRRIRGLSEGLAPSEATAVVHAKLHLTLKSLSENLQQHLFLENQILFRRTS